MKQLLIFLLFFLSFSLFAQLPWDYPIKPGSNQWAEFKTGQQMVDACQIPKDVLASLSTKDLAEICLNFPLYINFLLVNNERIEIDNMINYFNGLKELSLRSDGARKLVSIYKNFPILTQIPNSGTIDHEIPYRIIFLELLLCNDLFLNQLNNNELAELGKIALIKYENKTKNLSVYSLFNVKRTLLLGAVIIDKLNGLTENDDDIKHYIINYPSVNPVLLSKISLLIIKNL